MTLKHPAVSRNIVIIQSIIYTLCFNSILINKKLTHLTSLQYYQAVTINFFTGFFLSFLIFYALSLGRKLYVLSSIVLFFCSSAACYFIQSFGITINATAIELVLYTDPEEANSVITFSFYIYVLGLTVLGGALATLIEPSQPSNKKKYLSGLLVFFMILSQQAFFYEQFFPFNLIQAIGETVVQKTFNKKINRFDNESIKASHEAEDLKIIVVIGESARGDHWSLNGYKRDTTPFLSTEKNLINYNIANSCSNTTHISVPCMLTRATAEHLELKDSEASFIEIFKKAGFKTTWLGNQGGYFSSEGSFMRLAQEADELIVPTRSLYQGSQHDETLIPLLRETLLKSSGRHLIILHMNGSHYHYESRYPREFEQFQPICAQTRFSRDVKQCSLAQIENSYDNTLLYSDYVLKKVIDELQVQPAFLIYSSDHGESLGENGVYLHGTHQTIEQRSVPFFIWYSNSYEAINPDRINTLKNNKKNHLNHDYIFHTVLEAGFIESPIIDKKLSLFQEREQTPSLYSIEEADQLNYEIPHHIFN